MVSGIESLARLGEFKVLDPKILTRVCDNLAIDFRQALLLFWSRFGLGFRSMYGIHSGSH